MSNLTKTLKLRIQVSPEQEILFRQMTEQYRQACNFVSQYIFDNSFNLAYQSLNKELYRDLRVLFGLKSQLAQSSIKTTMARYKTVSQQLFQKPYKYKDEDGSWKYITKTLEWLWKPIFFKRPQADLVRNRDYSFVDNGQSLSINTLGKRTRRTFESKPFSKYLDGSWNFGTEKLVELKGRWYLHIPVTKAVEVFQKENVRHVVGIDRGLRFLTVSYDEQGKTEFVSGRKIAAKRHKFLKIRQQLQSKGTKSAKQNYDLRSWTFYQLEQFLTYKAHENRSKVLKVSAKYTSQRCPKCGIIHKENRDHSSHLYCCQCGYQSNDDRIGAINIQLLGSMWISGDNNPRYERKTTALE